MNLTKIEDLLNESAPNHFGAFSEVVAEFEASITNPARPVFEEMDDVYATVLQNGRQKISTNGTLIPWQRGLSSFCSVASDGVIGELAAAHSDAKTDLYAVWEDLEGSEECEPMYLSLTEATGDPRKRGAYLNPGLDIANRDRLSDHYIGTILRPYAGAEIQLRKSFFKAIEASHLRGEWMGFRSIGLGEYVPMHPGAGFDGHGNYTIDRATYLKGFGYGEDELGTENYRHRKPYDKQETWLFLTPSKPALLSLVTTKNPQSPAPSKTGRPSGTGFAKQDEPFVQLGVDHLRNGRAKSAMEAARLVLQEFEAEIAGSGTWESKLDRLRRQISKALK